MTRTLAVSFAALLLIGCGGAGKPTQEQLAKQLTEVAAALEAGDLDKAAPHLLIPPGRSIDELKGQLPRILERQDISAAGVKILLEKGKFGPIADVFPEHGGRRAKRFGVKVEECYGLRLDRAEVMAHWDGKTFKLFRLDDIGKLSADTPADDAKPTDEKPTDEEPAADEEPADEKPADEKPADSAPAADEKPADPAPAVDEEPAEPAPAADEKPAEPAPAADEKPAEPAPAADEKPADPAPAADPAPKTDEGEGAGE